MKHADVPRRRDSRVSFLDRMPAKAPADLVSLPYAVSQAGFVMGIGLLIGLAIIADWTIRLVVLNAKLSGQDSYTNVRGEQAVILSAAHPITR